MINDNPILNIDYIEDGDIKQFAGISLSNWKEYRKQNKDSKIEVKSWAVWQTPVEELRERYQQVAKQYFDSEKVENNESSQVEETKEKQETEIPGIVWTNIEKNDQDNSELDEINPKIDWILKSQEQQQVAETTQENIKLNEPDEEIFNTLEEMVEVQLQQNELKQLQDELGEKLDQQIKNAQASLKEDEQPVQKQELTFENKISDIVKRVDDKLDEFVRDPERLANYLEFATNIRNKYTARNIAMVHKQFEGATILKSFTDWKKEKVAIKKGSKALKILQPVTDKFIEINGEKIFKKQWTDEIKQKIKKKELKVDETIKGFKLANTFDISQTTLKKEQYPKNYFAFFIKGEPENEQYHQRLFSELKQFLETKNIPVYETEALGQMKGFSDHKSIYLNEHNSTKENITTLLHEYGHMKFNHSYEDTSRSECEYQAEMISLVFSKKFNIDTENHHLDYIKGWNAKSTQKDRIDWIKPVVNVAREINDEIELFLKQQLEAKEKEEQEKKKQEQLQQEQEKKRQELQEQQETQNKHTQKAFPF
ncbi:ImmA/IrrE family metallo-endopeptidase [Mycoplasma yeatsii]|uniref:IrrE N-terminal-like domain-containing protein n=1 Tax=Mycoplasma yeatsii TaxID=51365 RepID=A0ABU0NEK4_9MOLU|nr:ImmA/IrrE family metallo-endopeptidase [Mycoplasma yeatsii]MDQ0567617.1 hypothetical protein [Mycoplasma yeatsii]